METHEELEDAALEQGQLRALQRRNDDLAASVRDGLSGAFGAESLEEAKALSAKLQYLQRIADEIEQRIDPDGGGL